MAEAPDLLKSKGTDEARVRGILEVQVNEERLWLSLLWLFHKSHRPPTLDKEIVVHEFIEAGIVGICDGPLPL
jgi:hypothetical protein